jgi:hypothetical protein
MVGTFRKLPPIFGKARSHIARSDTPAVLFQFSKEHIDAARKQIADLKDEVPLFTYAHCWMETPFLGILAYCPDDQRVNVRAWNRNGKLVGNFSFCEFTDRGLTDLETVIKAQYFQAAFTLHIHTESAAEVSVNTLSRNAPRAYRKEGNTLRFVPIADLATAAGHARQRDYVRPDEPSGIRMREHDVRGHWRTFPSGARVWVKPHRRGDPELGRVTRVVSA